MFFPHDVTNEIVAHFIGYFQLSVEDLRVRLDYQKFFFSPDEDPVPEDETAPTHGVTQNLALGNFTPNSIYAAPDWGIAGHSRLDAMPPFIEVTVRLPSDAAGDGADLNHANFGKAHLYAPQEGEDALSTVALVNQTIVLEDNDVLIFADFEGSVVFVSGAAETILSLHAEASAISDALIGTPNFSGPSGIADFITDTAGRIEALGENPDLDGASVVIAPTGSYVNGVASAETPDLLDHLPTKLAEQMGKDAPALAAPDSDPPQTSIVADDMPPSLTLNAGGNLLVNEANVVNAGLNTAIMAVQGNYHQLDVVIQVNAFSDVDTIIGAPPGLTASGTATAAYNIASFQTETHDGLGKAAEANPGAMPLSWNVTVVSGDLVFVEWMKQYTFQSDQDVHGLTATGINTIVTTGENVGFNAISFLDIGKYFDLVIVGGNLYDANIIVQTNVLYDNDTIQYLGGNHTGGSVATQGNLLWNEASIVNVGPTEISSDMPDHFTESATVLANGGRDMPAGFGSDCLFEGLNLLRVLYVEGDIYDLRYLQQTNVLGDADFVALQKARLIGDGPGADWDINSGGNALINQAKIVDYDGVGDIAYVGGQLYSDSILIQANILSADHAAPGGDALVTEVIAFLDHDVPDVFDDVGTFSSSSISSDGPPADIMQTVLA